MSSEAKMVFLRALKLKTSSLEMSFLWKLECASQPIVCSFMAKISLVMKVSTTKAAKL